MAQSLSKLYVHLIFSTKSRRPFIHADWQPQLWAYLSGGFEDHQCHTTRIGGIEDHIHILFELHRTIALSKLVNEIKSESTKWVKSNQGVSDFAWQTGYGAFSVSASNIEDVTTYIRNQAQHHQKQNFKDEFLTFLDRHQVPYDERYIWD